METIAVYKTTSSIEIEAKKIMDDTHHLFTKDKIKEGCQRLICGMNNLYRNNEPTNYTPELKQYCLSHPIMNYLNQEATVSHSLSKPRGYSGDADMIDYYYRLKGNYKNSTFFGREIHNILMDSTSCASVRWRAKHLSEIFQSIYHEKEAGINVLSVASGHIRELGYIENRNQVFNKFTALDQDNQSNNEARSSYDGQFLNIVDESISYILRDGFKDQEYDFVYSAGLFDYLNDKLASKLIQKLYACVKKGGSLLVPNFAKGITERAFMDIFMDWELIYRNEEDMSGLAENAGVPEESISLYRDPMHNVIYMKISK